MSDAGSIDAVIAALHASHRSVDVLVNNAGATFPDGRDEWEPDAFAASLALNLAGPMRLTIGIHPLLRASELDGGASVINLSSMSAYRSVPMVPGYGASKAATINLTMNLARRWVDDGIRVNALAPGLIDTPMTAPMTAFPELLDAELAHTPMARMGTPEEVAGAALFLSSSARALRHRSHPRRRRRLPAPLRSPCSKSESTGRTTSRVDDVAPPSPGPADAVVRIAACGICGSDLSYIRWAAWPGPGPSRSAWATRWPASSTGSAPTWQRVRVGDRVVVQPGNEELGRIGGGGPEGGLTPELLVRQADAGSAAPGARPRAPRRRGVRRAARGRHARGRPGRRAAG